ncbi:galactokinase [Bacillus thuringiensis]|uniref:GHMP family kinase ATP-binding protein n=1 Tax=Bacillus thuringiensis TaxID=1428 RepID=UPI003335C294
MIISKTPMRISLGGGGTDLPFYASKYGGFVISASINKYCNIMVNSRDYDNKIKLNYSEMEIVENVNELKHDIYRESLKLTGIKEGIEITSISDVPIGTGLGGSGAFTVGLLNALYTKANKKLNSYQLAELACKIEIDILKQPSGKQDQYISSFGGIKCLEIDCNGRVEVSSPNISRETLLKLEKNTFMFYTGMSRQSAEVLGEQDSASKNKESNIIESLHKIKEIGKEIQCSLENGNTSNFGRLMHKHWLVKRQMSTRVSNSFINKCYDVALDNGALGGKIMGAGNGGFFLFYCDTNPDALCQALKTLGLIEVDYKFDFSGSRILVK